MTIVKYLLWRVFRVIEIETHFLDGCTVFTDLSADPTLFMGQGDYQFEVYRLMQKENGWVYFNAVSHSSKSLWP